MDSYAFDDYMDFEPAPRRSRSKPEKRKWREIEALKDCQRLRKELQEMDLLHDYSLDDLDY
ncbi:DUF3545 family protein [Photobacterium damselae subsp. piscicida]|nr:DUF3545 family protein [Photobacterium damselae subsp. piscicida]